MRGCVGMLNVVVIFELMFILIKYIFDKLLGCIIVYFILFYGLINEFYDGI